MVKSNQNFFKKPLISNLSRKKLSASFSTKTALREVVLEEIARQRYVTAIHISQTSREVLLLPLPPHAVEVSVVEVEKGVSWATDDVKHLYDKDSAVSIRNSQS